MKPFFETSRSIEELTKIAAPVGETLWDMFADVDAHMWEEDLDPLELDLGFEILAEKIGSIFNKDLISLEDLKMGVRQAMGDSLRGNLENHAYNLIKDSMEDMAKDTEMDWHWEDPKGNKCEFYEAESIHLKCSKRLWRDFIDNRGSFPDVRFGTSCINHQTYTEAEFQADDDLEDWVNDHFSAININDGWYGSCGGWEVLFKDYEEISHEYIKQHKAKQSKLKAQIKHRAPLTERGQNHEHI